jgi:hypothetical protein
VSPRVGRRWRLAVVASVAALCSACVSIPDTSPVRESDDVQVGGPSQQISNIVPGPRVGDSPAGIVRGFIDAMLAFPQSSATAREFLTQAAGASWDPRESAIVYDDLSINEADEAITVTVDALGSVDGRGAWRTSPPSESTRTYPLRMELVDGEWRIATPPDGILIDADFFDRNYAPYALYFLDPTRTILTPDPVYLPLGETAATALVDDLLRGPTGALAGAATSAATTDVEVDPAVSISPTGVADVSLTSSVLELSESDRRLLAAQLAWTLSQVPEISAVTMTVDGSPAWAPDDADDEFTVADFSDLDPAGEGGDDQLYALSPQGLVLVGPSDATAAGGPVAKTPPGASVAVDPLGALAAMVSADRTAVTVAGIPTDSEVQPRQWVRGRSELIRPSWDPHGVLWTVASTDGRATILAATESGVTTVDAPGLTGRRVVAFAVSRDGVRAAAIVRGPGGRDRLMVSTIDRSAEQPARVSLGRATAVSTAQLTLDRLTALAWSSPTSIAVLGSVAGAEQLPYEVEVDGSRIAEATAFLDAVPRTLAAGPNLDAPIVVGDGERRLFVLSSDSWLQFGGDVPLRAPVYPG